MGRVDSTEGLNRQPIEGRIGMPNADVGREAADVDDAAVRLDGHAVDAVSALDDDGIGLPIAEIAADGASKVDVDRAEVRAGDVVHRHRIASAERANVDPLDPTEVHRDRPEIPGEQD